MLSMMPLMLIQALAQLSSSAEQAVRVAVIGISLIGLKITMGNTQKTVLVIQHTNARQPLINEKTPPTSHPLIKIGDLYY